MNNILALAARPAIAKTAALAALGTSLYLATKLGFTPMDHLGHWFYRGG